MNNTYDYSAIWNEIADSVESGLTDRLSKIDFEGIIKKALSRYNLKLDDIDWDSKSFQLALSKGLFEALNGVKKEVKTELGEFDIGNYMKLNEKSLNIKIKSAFENMIKVSKEYGKEAAQEFTDEFFQAMTVAKTRKFRFPDQFKESWEDAYDDLMNELRVGLGGKDSGEYKIGSDLEAKFTKASQTYQEWYIAIQDKIKDYRATTEIAKNVVNTIRQSLPKNATENQIRDVVNGLLESSGVSVAKTQESLKEMSKTVESLGDAAADQHIADAYKNLFDEIKKVGDVAGLDTTNAKLRESLEELKLINKETESLKLVNQGYTNEGGIIGEDTVVLLRNNTEESLQNSQTLMTKLDEAYKKGVNVSRIIDVINDGSRVFMEIQEKMSGETLGNGVDFINWDFLDATEEQINRFAEDIKKLQELGIGVDINMSNIFYDKEKGFGFIDLDLKPAMYKGVEDFLDDFRGGVVGEIEAECEEMNKDLEKIPFAQSFYDKFAESFNKVTDSHSPSEKARQAADNVINGVVEELTDRTDDIEKAGEEAGKAAIQGMVKGFSEELSEYEKMVGEWINSNVDLSTAPFSLINNSDEAISQITEFRDELQRLKDEADFSTIDKKMQASINNDIKMLDQLIESAKPAMVTKSIIDEDDVDAYLAAMDDKIASKLDLSIKETTEDMSDLGEEMSKVNTQPFAEKVIDDLKEVQEQAEKVSDTLQQVGDKLTMTGYHGTARKWQGDVFDLDQTRAAQMGSGMYFVDSPEKLEGFLKRPGSGDIKKTELSLEKCFILTEDYISSLEDINKILGTTFDKTTKAEDVISAIRNFSTLNKENSLSFRQSMLDLGYQGMYVGNNLANKKINDELVVYDESLLQNLETINKADFQTLLGNIENVTKAEIEMGEQGKVATDKIKESLQEVQQEVQETQKLLYHWGNDKGLVADDMRSTITHWKEGKQKGEPYGMFGTGTYAVGNPNLFNGIVETLQPFRSPRKYLKIDASKLNLYETKTSEHAQQLMEYLETLQQYCISFATGYDWEGTFDVAEWSPEKLYNLYKSVFKEATLDFEQFNAFLTEMYAVVQDQGFDKKGNVLKPKNQVKTGRDSISTRFMKLLGYNGVNNTGTDKDNFVQGSVIFNLPDDAVIKRTEDLLELTKEYNESPLITNTAVANEQQLAEETAKANSVIEEQKQKIVELEGQVDDLSSSLKAQGDELAHANEEYSNMMDELGRANDREDMISDELQQQRQITDELRAQNEEHQKTIAAMQEEMEDDQRHYTFVDEELGRQKELNDTLRVSVETERQARKEAEQRADVYRDMADSSAYKEYEADEQRRIEVEARLEAEKALKSAEEQSDALREQNETLKQSLELTKQVAKEYKEQFDSIQSLGQTTGKTGSNVGNEVKGFNRLADSVKAVTNAVNEKTEAFKKEQSVVKDAVGDEAKIIGELKGAVDDVKQINKEKQNKKAKQTKDENAVNIKRVTQYYARLEKNEQRYQALVAKHNAGLNLTARENETLRTLQNQRDAEQDILQSVKKRTAEIKKAQQAYEKIRLLERQNADITIKDSLRSKIADAIDSIQNKSASGKFTPESVNLIKSQLAQSNIINDYFTETNSAQLKEYLDTLTQLDAQFVKMGNETKMKKLLSDISAALADNTKMSQDLRGQFDSLAVTINDSLRTGASQEQVKALTNRFIELKTEMISSSQTGRSFFGMIKNDISQASARAIAQYLSFQDFIRYIRTAVSAVTELNTALNQLRIVSGETESSVNRVGREAYTLANNLGMSTAEVVSSITEWRRLGKSIDESMILAEQAARLATGGMMDISSATTALVSSMQAFEMKAEEINEVVDQYIYIGNNYSITSEQLATSLTKSMAALKVAGNSLEEIEALEVAGNTIMQDADAVSNALKVNIYCLHIEKSICYAG